MRGADITRAASELWLRYRIWRAERNKQFHRAEAKYHDRAKCTHRDANSEHRRLARHFEAEVARLRSLLNDPAEPIAKRVEA